MIKLFAMDLDKTTFSSRTVLEEKTIKALRDLDDKGVKFVFASGRIASSVDYYMKKTGLDNPISACNGAYVRINSQKVISEDFIDDRILKKITDYAIENNLIFHFYDQDTFYSNRFDLNYNGYLVNDEKYGYNLQAALDLSMDPFANMKKKGRGSYKFQLVDLHDGFTKSYEEMKKDMEAMDFIDKIELTQSGGNNLEIMKKGVNKRKSILKIGDFLGIEPDEIATIGDHENDVEMIKNAKYGFAVGNAVENAKKAAKFIMPTNDEYAVACACQKILEINRDV